MLQKLLELITNIFRRKRHVNLGLYGSPNAGKTTLANKIAKDFVGKEIGTASEIPHETRTINRLENVVFNHNGNKLEFTLLDMPGISTKIDYREFMKYGLNKKEAQQRAREATKGVIEAIKMLENVDAAILVLDATEDPYTEVNLTILGNLEAKKIPIIIAANKIDLENADLERVKNAFSDYGYPIIGISALKGHNIDKLYEELKKKIN
ncbi:MAG: Era-like GTP-binding protein [Candidatus Micrarchaeota archaeon]|nr:Era-like GTP-binding protein [Candidatus Micrarchaeota archaeon]